MRPPPEPAPRADQAAPLFAALGDATRLGIVRRLGTDGPLTTMRLTEATALSRQGMTKHLLVLEHAGLVSHRRAGRDLLWDLQRHRLREAGACLAQISAQWDRALERLRGLVEAPGA